MIVQDVLAVMVPPVNLTECAVGRETVPLPQVVARLASFTAVRLLFGKVSVMVAPVKVVEVLFSKVMVSRLLVEPSLGIVLGENVLETVTAGFTVIPPVTADGMVAPCVVLKSAGLIVLVYAPDALIGALTVTVSVQEPPAGIVPPLN